MKDGLGRNINYLRISITDCCNLSCSYCRPRSMETSAGSEILSFEEITEAVREAAALGISRIKLTGGEPLMREGCAELAASLKQLPGIEQVTLTTNGVLLESCAMALRKAGVDAVNVSLDTLRRERYRAITGADRLDAVIRGIAAAADVGLRLRINVVLQEAVNADELPELVELARDGAADVRFIELMPMGNADPCKGVAGEEVIERLRELYPELEEAPESHGNGPARYYRLPGFKGRIGLINAVTEGFCHSCNRIRMTSGGYVKPCLCYEEGVDLAAVLRGSFENTRERRAMIRACLASAIESKPSGHCFSKPDSITEKRRMIEIGG